MDKLTLHPGARLTFCRWDSQRATPALVEEDVTHQAAHFLFETVTLADGVTLADVFGLLEAAPVLKVVQTRNFVEAFCKEAQLGVSSSFVPGYAADAIEYLELYQVWALHSGTRTYHSTSRWRFRGIGYELRADAEGFDAGDRIPWGVSGASLRELLPLPLRINIDVAVCEDDLDSKTWGHTIETVKLLDITLGQLIDGVLWELSFYGPPSSAREHDEQLRASRDCPADESTMAMVGDNVPG